MSEEPSQYERTVTQHMMRCLGAPAAWVSMWRLWLIESV